MDENMEVDELFGDTAMESAMESAMDMPLPTPLKGLPQRLHELHTSGNSQLIAWSKTGLVAYVSQDGLSVKFAYLACNPTDGTWTLREDPTMDKTIPLDGKHPVVNLLWGPTFMDLAIADSAGRITIANHSYMTMSTAAILRRASDDQENDLNQPVGMLFLNRERPLLYFLPASKDHHNWGFLPTKRVPFGPYHHLAIAVVTKSGNFRLLYQQANNNWKTASATLQRMSSTNEIVTHATMCANKDGSLIIAMQTYDRKLHIYRAKIEFVPEKNQPDNIKQASITIEHIRGNISCGIFKETNTSLLGESTLPSYATMNLSHLEIVPTSDIERTPQVPPIILAVYSASLNSMGLPNFANGPPSVIARLQLSLSEDKLHPSFDEIGSKVDAKPRKRIDVNRLEDIPLDQVVVSIQHVDHGMIAIVLGDGSIQIHDPTTLANLHNEQELGKASNLPKAGFAFQGLQPEIGGLHVALSPNGCVAAIVDAAGKLHCRDMKLWQTVDEGNQQLGIETAINTLALTFARGCINQNAAEDILKIMIEQFGDHTTKFLEILYRTVFSDADYTSGLDTLAKKTFIPRILSMQAAFGYKKTRTVSSSFGWTTLNIRYISLLLLTILTYSKQGGGVEYRDPDLLSSILRNINYAQSLFAYLFNNLFEEASPTFPPSPNEPPHSELTSLLLLSSWSRFFLRHLSRALRGLALLHQSGSSIAPKAVPAFRRIATEIDPTFSLNSANLPLEPSSPVKMEAVERLLVGIDKFVGNAYEAAGLTTDAQKAAVEREMLANARIPTILSGVIPRAIKEILPISKVEVNRLDVWEGDYSWLELWTSLPAPTFIDVHKKRRVKVPMSNEGKGKRKVRRCVRCAEVSEDLVPGRGLPLYFRTQISRCVCEAHFYVEKIGV